MKLLNVDQNAKTVKGQKKGYLTGVMYMSPAKISGYEVCPGASKACREACLNTAGRGVFSNVKESRLKKTKYFFEDRENFLKQLVKEISALIRKAAKLDLIPVIRLNGTSDINFMKIPVGFSPNIFGLFPEIQFYDYTKNFNMLAQSEKIENYHLTFSYSGENKKECQKALNQNFSISAVFAGKYLPALFDVKTFKGSNDWQKDHKTVYNGDLSDLRFLDKKGIIVGLIAKGPARKLKNSFIIEGNLKENEALNKGYF